MKRNLWGSIHILSNILAPENVFCLALKILLGNLSRMASTLGSLNCEKYFSFMKKRFHLNKGTSSEQLISLTVFAFVLMFHKMCTLRIVRDDAKLCLKKFSMAFQNFFDYSEDYSDFEL